MPCNSCCKKRSFEQCMTLDVINDTGTPQGQEFKLKLKFEVQKNEVILRLPAFSFTIDYTNENHYYSSGATLGTIDGFIPKHLRPDTLIHQATAAVVATSDVHLALYVSFDGSIRVGNPAIAPNLIPNGTYLVSTTTITYLLSNRCCTSVKPPENIRATNVSNAYIVDSSVGYPLVPLEYEDPFFFDNKFGLNIPSRPAVLGISPINNLFCNWTIRTGSVSNSGAVTLNAPQLISEDLNVYHQEGSIRVDPNNSDNLAASIIRLPSKGPASNTVLGTLTANAVSGNTILNVQPDVARLSVVGSLLEIRKSDNSAWVQLGRIASINTGANTVTLANAIPVGISFTVPPSSPGGNRIRVQNGEVILTTSTDGGTTWMLPPKRIDNLVFPNNIERSDPNILYDDYGNLWYCAMYINDGKFPPTQNVSSSFFIGFAVSQDGGDTFTEVGRFINSVDNVDPDSSLYTFNDYPRMSFGGDGAGGKALWFSTLSFTTNVDRTLIPLAQLNVGYFKVNGNTGNVAADIGSIQYQQLNRLSYDIVNYPEGAFGAVEIIATPSGKVYVYTASAGPVKSLLAPIILSVNENGTVGLNENSFSDWRQVVNNNISGSLSFTNRRSYNLKGYVNNTYDPESGRLYQFVSENVTLLDNSNQQVSLIYSEDDGKTWSKRIKINSVDEGVRGYTHIQRDPVSGGLLLQWFDTRNDTIGTSCDMYIAVLTKEWLDSLPPVCE